MLRLPVNGSVWSACPHQSPSVSSSVSPLRAAFGGCAPTTPAGWPHRGTWEKSIIDNPPPQSLAVLPTPAGAGSCWYQPTVSRPLSASAVGRDRYMVDRDGGFLGGAGKCRFRHHPSPCQRRPWRPRPPCPHIPDRTPCRCCRDTVSRPRRRRPRPARRCSRWQSARLQIAAAHTVRQGGHEIKLAVAAGRIAARRKRSAERPGVVLEGPRQPPAGRVIAPDRGAARACAGRIAALRQKAVLAAPDRCVIVVSAAGPT